MIGLSPPRALRTVARLTALLALAMLLAAPVARAESSEEAKTVGGYTAEPFSTFEQQLASKQVASVVFLKRLRTIRITLEDGSKFAAKYPKKQSGLWEAKIRRAGATATKLSPEQEKQVEKETLGASGKHHKHKIRYIVGGVVLLLIVIGAIVLLLRRRRHPD